MSVRRGALNLRNRPKPGDVARSKQVLTPNMLI
jgi:hypothetical protein